MEGWRQWRLGWEKKACPTKKQRTHLTPTGLLMEGDSASVRFLFAKIVNERYRVLIQQPS